MSLVYDKNVLVKLPDILTETLVTVTSVTLNAANETCHMVGHIFLENPIGGSKTISSAGGGSIIWRTTAATFASGSTTFVVGLQDVSTASTISQGDGSFDVEASFTGGGGGITANATQTSVMTSGSKTLAHGDLVSIAFSMTARGGADVITVALSNFTSSSNWPCVTANTAGSFTKLASNPLALIVFDDGSKGFLYFSNFHYVLNAAVVFNVDSSTADEYGNLIIPQKPFMAMGVRLLIDINANAHGEIILYSDPLGTPVATRTVTVDSRTVGTSTATNTIILFSSPYQINPNTPVGISYRPTTTTSNSLYYSDSDVAASALGAPNEYAYAIRRIDNSGAFSDYNGGTAKTRLMNMQLLGHHLEQGVNKGNYHVGI